MCICAQTSTCPHAYMYFTPPQSKKGLDMPLAPLPGYFDKPAPNNLIKIVDGNKHSFTFSFADFLNILLKFVTHSDGKHGCGGTKMTGIHPLATVYIWTKFQGSPPRTY